MDEYSWVMVEIYEKLVVTFLAISSLKVETSALVDKYFHNPSPCSFPKKCFIFTDLCGLVEV